MYVMGVNPITSASYHVKLPESKNASGRASSDMEAQRDTPNLLVSEPNAATE